MAVNKSTPDFTQIRLDKNKENCQNVHFESSNKTFNIDKVETVDSLITENLKSELVRGIIKIFQTTHWLIRIFLLISVIGTVGMTSFMIIDSFLAYFEYKVATTTRTIFETPTIFPKVTFCNLNSFTTDVAVEFLKEVNKNYSSQYDIFNVTQMNSLNYTSKKDFLSNISWIAAANMNTKRFSDEKRKLLGHSLKDILLSCSFDQQKCSISDFVWKFDKVYGNCYVFNSGFNSSGSSVPLKHSTFAGSEYRLKIRLYVNYHESLSLFNAYNGGYGAIVFIENNTNLNQVTNTIQVPPGFITFVKLDRSFKFNLPKPYSNCDIDNYKSEHFESELFKLIQHSPYQYTQQLCFEQCLQKLLIEDCNCTDSYFVSLVNSDYCETDSQINCMSRVIFEKFPRNNFIQKHCLPLCPLECNRTEYHTSLSTSQLLGEKLYDLIESNINLTADFLTRPFNLNTAKESVVEVGIFYDSVSYTISTETEKFDLVALLASIGGHLGLFLGVSIFSICEMIEVLIEILYLKKKQK